VASPDLNHFEDQAVVASGRQRSRTFTNSNANNAMNEKEKLALRKAIRARLCSEPYSAAFFF
jgi:hypothetical protein